MTQIYKSTVDMTISILTEAVKVFGGAYCAVPHIKLSVQASASDIGLGQWEANLSLVDKAPKDDLAPYTREWFAEAPSYGEALQTLCRIITVDVDYLLKEAQQQVAKLSDAADILTVLTLVEGGEETPREVCTPEETAQWLADTKDAVEMVTGKQRLASQMTQPVRMPRDYPSTKTVELEAVLTPSSEKPRGRAKKEEKSST